MRNLILIFFLSFSFSIPFFAQTGCPGCVVDLPEGMPVDTLFLGTAADGQVNEAYDSDLSFRLPVTTTTVAETDPSIPAGLGINEIKIDGLSNLPPGLTWEVSQETFTPADLNDGCVKICGTPLQPGLYNVQVGVTAQIFVISQQTSFSFPIYIAPAVSYTDGFNMENSEGCGTTTVNFENNIPSNGQEGFSYFWDFGNGVTSIDENPAPQIYTEAGNHEVNYQVTVDTAGYFLTRIIVESVACSDIFGEIDMSAKITDPNGTEIFLTEVIPNMEPPVTFDLNVPIGEGNYTLEIRDRDSGINGGDDSCGSISFNQLSSGSLVAGDLSVNLLMNHQTEIIQSTDIVVVYPLPDAPEVMMDGLDTFCEGDSLILTASYDSNLQWYNDTLPLVGENSAILKVTNTGNYSVVYQDENGCTAVSETIEVTVFAAPVAPEITVNGPTAFCEGIEITLTASYNDNIQWYEGDIALEGENEPVLLVSASGDYSVVYEDENNCATASETVSVTVREAPAVPELENINNLLTISNSEEYSDPVFALQWYFEGEAIPLETSSMYCSNFSGTYTMEVTNTATGCQTYSDIAVLIDEGFVDCVSGTTEVFELVTDFQLFPNPATTDLTVRFDLQETMSVDLRLVDVLGRVLYQWSQTAAWGDFEHRIEVSDWAEGIYFMEIGIDGQRMVRTVVVE